MLHTSVGEPATDCVNVGGFLLQEFHPKDALQGSQPGYYHPNRICLFTSINFDFCFSLQLKGTAICPMKASIGLREGGFTL